MKKIYNSLIVCISLVLLASCQKELTMDFSLGQIPGGTSDNLKGNWKFIGMHSKTESIVELSDGIDVVKTITISEYNSTRNTGTLQIDASKMTSIDFGYQVDTIAKVFIYENDILLDTLSAPFSFILPASNSVSDYTQVSSDSIYFTGGQFVNLAGSSPLVKPTGVKLKFQGDNLMMTMNLSVSDIQNVLGIRQTTKETVKAVMTYQKQ